ncbi:hypothetical protein RF55_17122 [Lasius niger]|uniref:Uncharacterized protein n=1 Tax=Lasius niger TaxID=67767 RepID=A0A0J7K2Y1_LASNI|nr:hypothetical protein RF55_17122 [Lasius niger]
MNVDEDKIKMLESELKSAIDPRKKKEIEWQLKWLHTTKKIQSLKLKRASTKDPDQLNRIDRKLAKLKKEFKLERLALHSDDSRRLDYKAYPEGDPTVSPSNSNRPTVIQQPNRGYLGRALEIGNTVLSSMLGGGGDPKKRKGE